MTAIKNFAYKEQIEQNVLGSIMLNNLCWDDICDIITVDDFYMHKHKTVFTCMASMMVINEPIDLVTLSHRLKELKQLDLVGGEIYLVELMTKTASIAHVKHYAKLLRNSSNDRALLNCAQTIVTMVNESAENRLDEAQRLVLEIAENKTNEPQHFKDFMPEVYKKIIDRENTPEKTIGISCGYEQIDKVIHGLRDQNLIVLAARPAMGKTLLALNMAEHVAINQQKSVLFISLEMSKEELGQRVITSLSGLNASQIKEGKYQRGDHEKLNEAYNKMFKSNFIVDDNAVLTVMDIRAKCRKIKRKCGLDLLIVDYLQLIKGVKAENETIKIGYISHGLKQIAKELNIPVIALCQLNRDIERRISKRPVMADLRQSGNIEQDADVIMFIDRKELHDESAPKGIADIYIVKNRDGEVGDVNLSFRGNNCRFDNLPEGYIVTKPAIQKPTKQKYGEYEWN